MKKFRSWILGLALVSAFPLSLVLGDIITTPLPFVFANGQVIDAGQFNANFNAIVTGVNNGAATSGVNNNITSLTGLTTAIAPSLGGSSRFYGGLSTGAANAQAVAVTPNNFSLVSGYTVSFIANFTNTTAMTLAVNGTTAKNVYLPTGSGPVALAGNEIVFGNFINVVYDGTQYQLVGLLQPPVGTIVDYAGPSAPAGWLFAIGQSLLRTAYPTLFAVVGINYGAVDGTHFSLPDLRGRMTAMVDGATNRITTATCSAPSTLGTACGNEVVTIVGGNLPAYTPTGTISGVTPAGTISQITPAGSIGVTDTTAYTFTYTNTAMTAGATTVVQTIQNSGGGSTITPVKTGTVTAALTGTPVTPTFTGTPVTPTFTGDAQGGTSTAVNKLNPLMIVNKIIKY